MHGYCVKQRYRSRIYLNGLGRKFKAASHVFTTNGAMCIQRYVVYKINKMFKKIHVESPV